MRVGQWVPLQRRALEFQFEVHERHFSINFEDGPGLDRNQSSLSLVDVRRFTVTTANCPALQTRMDALSKVAISLPERDRVFLHPPIHRIVINLGGTNIDAKILDQDNPLVRWATQTADAILACATR